MARSRQARALRRWLAAFVLWCPLACMAQAVAPPPAPDPSAPCLRCHQGGHRLSTWAGSAHASAGLSCASCHRAHRQEPDPVLARATQAEACTACHRQTAAQFRAASHHPVPEGAMTCSDCHVAHGEAGPGLLRRDSINETCHDCHADKRGPFVQPHEPVGDDCTICHQPHGGSVAPMLRQRPPLLCHQCHTPHVAGAVGALGDQPGVYTPAVPGGRPAVTALSGGKNVVTMWQGRSCLNCHTQIHGSNHPAAGPLLLR